MSSSNIKSPNWRKNSSLLERLIKSFYGGSRGAVFSKSAPLAAGGKIIKKGGKK
jgi:hypothetical protein